MENEHTAGTPQADGKPDFLAIAEVPKHFPLTAWQVRTAIWAGKLAARRVGKRLIVHRTDVTKFLLAQPKVRHGLCPAIARKKADAA